MTEVLMIEVQITTTSAMEREEGNVSLVCFTGSCHCRNFCGEIMEGGVDTQVGKSDGTVTLSARYLLDGADCDRKPCRIYVENNAIVKKDGQIATTPRILTNSSALKWLETAKLSGTVEDVGPGKIRIHIFAENHRN